MCSIIGKLCLFVSRTSDVRQFNEENDNFINDDSQERRRQLVAERTRALKSAYDRKIDRIKGRAGTTDDKQDVNRRYHVIECDNICYEVVFIVRRIRRVRYITHSK
jgi:hypothetical protein